MKLMLTIIFFVSSSVMAMDCPTHIAPQALTGGLNHIKRFAIQNDKLRGYHYHKSCSSLESNKEYSICKINSELWIVIPKGFKSDDFHGGYVIYQGKNYGWKSFFPSSWNEAQLKSGATAMLENMHCIAKEADKIGGMQYTYESQGVFPYSCKIIVYSIKRRMYVKTLYPDIKEIKIDGLNDIAFSQKYVYKEIAPDPLKNINDAIEQEDAAEILGMVEREDTSSSSSSAISKKDLLLQQLLKVAIGHRKPDMVDLLIALGAIPDKENIGAALKESSHPERDHLVIPALLSSESAIKIIDETMIKLALKHRNKKVMQELVKWALRNDQEELLKNIPAEYKSLIAEYKNEIEENKTDPLEQEAKAAQKKAAQKREKKELKEKIATEVAASNKWLAKTGPMPDIKLTAKLAKQDIKKMIIDISETAIKKNAIHMLEDLLSVEEFKSYILEQKKESYSTLKLAFKKNDQAIINLLLNNLNIDQIKDILSAWKQNKDMMDANIALLLHQKLEKDSIVKWLKSAMPFLSDEQMLRVLKALPELKEDDALVQEIKRNKFTQSLDFIMPSQEELKRHPIETSFIISPSSAQSTQDTLSRFDRVIEADPLLKKIYDQAMGCNKSSIDSMLKKEARIMAKEKITDERLKAFLMNELLKELFKNKELIEQFWAGDAFEVMADYCDHDDIAKTLANNFKKNKDKLACVRDTYIKNNDNKKIIDRLKECSPIFRDIVLPDLFRDQEEKKTIHTGISTGDERRKLLFDLGKQVFAEKVKLANMLRKGDDGVEKDPKAAYAKYQEVESMEEANPIDKVIVKFNLANMLRDGEGVEQDLKAADAKYQEIKAIEQDSPVAMRLKLAEMLRNGDYVKKDSRAAYTKYQEVEAMAQANLIDKAIAKTKLAEMLHDGGDGMEKDRKAAYAKYQEVEAIGQARPVDKAYAKLNLANMLYSGDGVEKDSNAAYAKYQEVEAIEQTNPIDKAIAKLQLAEILRSGHGVEKDLKAAYAKYQEVESMEQANPITKALAKLNLAEMLRDGGDGVEKDPKAAYAKYQEVESMEQARPIDKALAKLNLANMLRDGDGVEQDLKAADAKYQEIKVIEQDNPVGMKLNLADMLRNGDGVKKDLKAAYTKYLQVEAMAQANQIDKSIAKTRLAEMLRNGDGVEKDPKVAYAKYQEVESMEQANPFEKAIAKSNLADMLRNGEGVGKDPSAAYEKYQEALALAEADQSRQDVIQHIKQTMSQMEQSGLIDNAVTKLQLAYKLHFGDGVEGKDLKAAYAKYQEIESIELARPIEKALAKLNLAIMLRYGEGVKPDSKAAYTKYQEVEAMGQANPIDKAIAKSSLADMLRDGDGVKKDTIAAYEKYQEALALAEADQSRQDVILYIKQAMAQMKQVYLIDKAIAKLNLADKLYYDDGVEGKDLKAAYAKYQEVESMEQANPIAKALAKLNLAGMLRDGGDGVEKDSKAAYAKYQEVESIELARPIEKALAKLSLADMLRDGEGVEKDTSAAYEKYQEALALAEADQSRQDVIQHIKEVMAKIEQSGLFKK